MVQIFKIPWAAWYGDEDLALEFPDTWDVKLYKMKDASEISKKEIEIAINNPIGAPTLKEIAQGKQNAVIVVETIVETTRRPRYITGMNSEKVKTVKPKIRASDV